MRQASKVKVKRKKLPRANKAGRGNSRKVRFKVKARPDSVVYIAGTFNRWDPFANRLEPDSAGCYIADIVLPAGRNEYKFLIDGVWHLDPGCAQCIPNVFGSHNNVIEID